MKKRRNLNNIEIRCPRSLRGHSVKITLLRAGYISLCEVAIYSNYG